jgi:hypothetical protein
MGTYEELVPGQFLTMPWIGGIEVRRMQARKRADNFRSGGSDNV